VWRHDLDVPSGALDEEVEIRIKCAEQWGSIGDLDWIHPSGWELTPTGLTFNVSATLSVKATGPFQGVPVMYVSETGFGGWERLDSTFDEETYHVEAQVEHLSVFILVAEH